MPLCFWRSICPGRHIPQLVEPSGPGPVTTLEALLGHISEHLLQLLGTGRATGGGGKESPGWRKCVVVVGGGGVLRNNSCLASRKFVSVGRGRVVYVCVCSMRAGGPGSDVA